MKKSEIILEVVLKILHSRAQYITKDDLESIIGKSRSSYYRYVEELTKYPLPDGSPALIKSQQGDKDIFSLNKSILKYFAPEHYETAFYFQAYKKLSFLMENTNFKSDLEEIKKDVFQMNGKAEQFERKFHYLSKANDPDKQEFKLANILTPIVSSLINNNIIHFGYFKKEYTVAPLTLSQYKDALYLICYINPEQMDEIRIFKLDRIADVKILDQGFTYPSAKDWSPKEYFSKSSGIVSGAPTEAVIRVYGYSRQLVKEKTFFNKKHLYSEPGYHGYDEYSLSYTNPDEFLGQLFTYMQDIKIISPENLLDAYFAKIDRALERYDEKKVA
jgi:predicted DNA-binding transcriptional regulator YafY